MREREVGRYLALWWPITAARGCLLTQNVGEELWQPLIRSYARAFRILWIVPPTKAYFIGQRALSSPHSAIQRLPFPPVSLSRLLRTSSFTFIHFSPNAHRLFRPTMPLPTVPTEIAQAAFTHPKPRPSPYMGNTVPEGYPGTKDAASPSSADKKKAARARFEAVFGVLRQELIDHFRQEALPIEAQEWYQRVSTLFHPLFIIPLHSGGVHSVFIPLLPPAPVCHGLTAPPQNLDYNVPGGKLNRGLSVVDSVALIKGRELSEDEYFKAAVLGWCVEMVRLSHRFICCHFLNSELAPYSSRHTSLLRTT